jgi:hypothetical protein
MPKFVKGNTGKPKGTKDLKWAKVSFWFDELKKDWPLLTSNQRANLSIEMMKLLTSKAKNLNPLDPTDSVINADEAMKLLNQIESKKQSDSVNGQTA